MHAPHTHTHTHTLLHMLTAHPDTSCNLINHMSWCYYVSCVAFCETFSPSFSLYLSLSFSLGLSLGFSLAELSAIVRVVNELEAETLPNTPLTSNNEARAIETRIRESRIDNRRDMA